MTVTRWTPLPASALSATASVAVSVLPSPVFISAIEPAWSTMPPIIWTSKWRMPIVRREVSRTTANVSGRRSSSGSPLRARSRSASACWRSSSSSRSSSSGSHWLMRSTRLAYCLNCLPSPRRRARSRIAMGQRIEAREARPGPRERSPLPGGGGFPGAFLDDVAGSPRDGRRGGGAGLAALAPLVAVALDLAGQLVRDQVDRVLEVARRLARAQRDALEVKRGLRHLAVGVGWVALLEELHLEDRELGDLLADLLEPARHTLA